MRNAVKATVDAYDGTVTLYAWDEDDPILKAWMGAFPDTVQDKDDDLRRAAGAPALPRGPVQGAALPVRPLPRRPTPDDCYQGNDRWAVPTDPQRRRGSYQPPYRLFVNEDEHRRPADCSLTSVYVPRGKSNLAAFVSVDSDATERTTYGKMRVLPSCPNEQHVRAPARSPTSCRPTRRCATRCWRSGQARRGTDLRQPADAAGRRRADVRPAGLRRPSGHRAPAYPILQFVLVSYGGTVGIGQTLDRGDRRRPRRRTRSTQNRPRPNPRAATTAATTVRNDGGDDQPGTLDQQIAATAGPGQADVRGCRQGADEPATASSGRG